MSEIALHKETTKLTEDTNIRQSIAMHWNKAVAIVLPVVPHTWNLIRPPFVTW